MLGKSLLLIPLLLIISGPVPSKPVVHCFGLLLFKPDGTKQSAVLYSDGTLDSAYISEKDTHYSDGYLIGEKGFQDKFFTLASKIYESSNSSETAPVNYDALILSNDHKNKVILYIETTDKKARQFERDFDKTFDSSDLNKLDAWLQTLLEK